MEPLDHSNLASLSLPYIYAAGTPEAEPGYGLSVPGQANQLKIQDNASSRQQLVQAGQQFEAYFISYMMKVMRETVPEGAITNKRGAYFHSLYDQEIGMRAAQAGGIGITQMVQEYADKYFSPPPVQPSSSSR